MIIKDAALGILVKVIGTLLTLLMSIILARSLGVEMYGVYSFAFAIVSIVGIPSMFGIPNLAVREIAKNKVLNDWATLKGFFVWSSSLIVIFSLCAISISIILLNIIGSGSLNKTEFDTILMGLVLVPFFAFVHFEGAAIRGLGFVIVGQLPETIIRPAILIISLCLFILFDESITSTSAMFLHIIASFAALVFGMGAILFYSPKQLFDVKSCKYNTRSWLSSATPLAFIASTQLINQQADIFLLGIFRTSSEVGIYKVATATGALVVFGLQAINMIVAPRFSELYIKNEIEKLQLLVSFGSKITMIIAFPIVIVFCLYGGYILKTIFGEGYEYGVKALVILSVGQLVSASMGPVALLLNMTGHEKLALKGMLLSVVINLVMNLVLIPWYGLEGAAISTACSLILWNLLLRTYALKELKIETFFFTAKHHNVSRHEKKI